MNIYSPTISGSLTISGSIITTGDGLPLTGSLVSSGSFTSIGNTVVSGSLTVITGSSIELQVLGTGIKIGNASVDNHTVTGSLAISGSATTALNVNNGALFVSSSGNVGIGTTNPVSYASRVVHIHNAAASITFLKLSNSTTGTGMDDGLEVGNSGVNGYLYNRESGPLILGTSGNDRVTITSAGLVGINKAAANAYLDVNGNTILSGSLTVITGSGVEFQVTDTGTRIGNIAADNHTVTGSLLVSGSITSTGNITARTLVVQTVTSSVSFITGSTKFGTLASNTHQFTGSMAITGGLVDISKDGQSLRIFPSSSNSARIQLQNNGSGGIAGANAIIAVESSAGADQFSGTSPFSFVVGTATQKAFHLGANSAVVMTVTGSNVGIGTSNPANILHVSSSLPRIISDTNTRFSVFNLYYQGSEKGAFYLDNQNKQIIVEANGDNTYEIKFNTAGSERMKITSGGNVQIDNGQLNTPKSLSFQANSSAGGNLGSIDWYNYQWDAAIRAQIKGETDTGLSNGKLTFWTGGGGTSLRMTINAAGSIGAPSGTNIYNASDIRLKRNITNITEGLNKIMGLNPVKFNWIEGFEPTEEDKDMLGFIAQEVQTVVPEAVEYFNNNNIIVGETTVYNPLRVNEKFIIPVLVKAIQELKAQNDALQSRIETLEQK